MRLRGIGEGVHYTPNQTPNPRTDLRSTHESDAPEKDDEEGDHRDENESSSYLPSDPNLGCSSATRARVVGTGEKPLPKGERGSGEERRSPTPWLAGGGRVGVKARRSLRRRRHEGMDAMRERERERKTLDESLGRRKQGWLTRIKYGGGGGVLFYYTIQPCFKLLIAN